MLLVATPFVLLQSFVVDAIGKASRSTFTLGSVELPIVGSLAIVFLVILIILIRNRLTWPRAISALVALLMIALAQQITDYYFGHKFYDLQQNWHYIAYGIFAYMAYRDLARRNVSTTKIILITYFAALLLSTFDEAFQMFLSSRVFDLGDIGKDLWGTLIGIILINLLTKEPEELLKDCRQLRFQSLREYLKHPFGLLIHMFAFALLLLSISSLLSDARHAFLVAVLTPATFAVYFMVFHMSQFRRIKHVMIAILLLFVAGQLYSIVTYHSENVVYKQYGLTVYKGVPVVFFDILVFPDGTFRLVDKKHEFNLRDRDFLLRHKPDILLIGSGWHGQGGRGFPGGSDVQFLYNRFSKKGTQLIILKTPEACDVFNRLKQEGKNVLFVLHNTC